MAVVHCRFQLPSSGPCSSASTKRPRTRSARGSTPARHSPSYDCNLRGWSGHANEAAECALLGLLGAAAGAAVGAGAGG
eukprot:15430119-Alexandrium_andersonii.AAC.1